jgi:nucleoporin NDC1
LRSVIDAFAADGAVTLAAESGVQNVHLTELLQSVGSAQNGGKQEAKVKMSLEKWIGRERWWRWDVLEKWAEHRQAVSRLLDAKKKWDIWWKGERKGRVLESYLPNRELDVLIIEGKRPAFLFLIVALY